MLTKINIPEILLLVALSVPACIILYIIIESEIFGYKVRRNDREYMARRIKEDQELILKHEKLVTLNSPNITDTKHKYKTVEIVEDNNVLQFKRS